METTTQKRPAATLPATMKAVRIHSYGGPEVLRYEDAPRPRHGPGEVLVRVHAAAINPVDWKIREGAFPGHKFPFILGWDFSGVVEAIAEGDSRFLPGDEVITRPNPMRDGAYAEFIAVPEAELARKPKSVDHIQAAGLSLAGLTAWQALFDHGGLQPGQKVLIHAAAGGVGMYAVQLAKWKGATVVGTASEKNREFVKELGADEFIDYQSARPEDAVRGMDLVLDLVGGDTAERSLIALKKGGILVSTVQPPPKEKAETLGVRTAIFMAQTRPDQLDEMARLVDQGKLKIHVGQVLPLSEARKAQEISQSRHLRGKIVLKVA
jgi:NADPH:quinone reductase-like Zn-dependent oxidoreductase